MAIVPTVLSGWVPRPCILNTRKCGVRAKFSGVNSVVEREQHLEYWDGCVIYTAYPLPLGQVWQITILSTTRKWTEIGLRVGITTTVPNRVSDYQVIGANGDGELCYFGKTLHYNARATKYSHLPSLHDFEVGNKFGLLLLPNGEVHLFLNGKNSVNFATELPVHKSLFGTVDVRNHCTKIKCEILSDKHFSDLVKGMTMDKPTAGLGRHSSDPVRGKTVEKPTAGEHLCDPPNDARKKPTQNPTLGERPSLPDLLQLDIPQVVGVDYEKFGVLLLDDTTGSQVDIIVDDCRERSEKIISRILKEWLKGRGKSVTWQTLIDTLRDCKHTDLADKIQVHICRYK